MRLGGVGILCALLALAGCGDDDVSTGTEPVVADPGAGPWMAVPAAQMAERCGLDFTLLAAADATLNRPYAVIRYGQLCHEFYPDGGDTIAEVFSTTKTLGALVTGIAAYQTRAFPRNGRKTGPLADDDRVDHWLDSFTFNPDARVGHVLAMVGHNRNLSFGSKAYQYDLVGAIQINRLSDIITTALQQDPTRLGSNLEEFTRRFLFEPLGMHESIWSQGAPDKAFAYSWEATVRDMARVGLLILHDGLWNGERILDAAWTYKMTHAAFEDANTGYGYLTWLNSASNYTFGERLSAKLQGPLDACAPLALYDHYPHGLLSEAPDCNYESPYTCQQTFDVGMWYAAGLGGQFIVGHRALDLLLVIKNFGDDAGPAELWSAVRPALVALDPTFRGDEAAFCDRYGANAYAPDKRDEPGFAPKSRAISHPSFLSWRKRVSIFSDAAPRYGP